MALEGSIKDFGVADILQLISQQQKTGILLVEQQEVSAEVYFAGGAITETRSSQQTARLGEILVKGGLLPAETMKRLSEKTRETFEHLGQLLLREGLVRKEDIEHILLTQIYETFYDILQWREGTYRFIPQNVKADRALVQVPSLESILLDVLRMIDEWPDIKSNLHSFAYVFGKVPDKTEEGLEADEALVYGFIDGRKTVREIIDGSILGRFAACKILVGLLDRGYIHLVGERTDKPSERLLSFRRTIAAASYLLLAGLVIALLLAPTRFPGSLLPLAHPANRKAAALEPYLKNGTVQKLRTGLELYYLHNNRYPDSIGELVSAGILRDRDATAAADGSITYARQGTAYTLLMR